MIKHWLKPALQTTYQDARYAGARTRYGLRPRAHAHKADPHSGEPAEHGADRRNYSP